MQTMFKSVQYRITRCGEICLQVDNLLDVDVERLHVRILLTVGLQHDLLHNPETRQTHQAKTGAA